MFTKTAIILAVAKLAASHTTFQSIVVDGKDQGQHFAVQTPSNGNNPIKDVTSTSMICNGGSATDDFVEIAAGSSIGMQWHHNDPQNDANDSEEPIAASHKGPVMVYMAKADTNGEGAVWTKIWEDGFKDGAWGVDRFIDNKGLITVDIPDLEAGEYLIRPEMIGLHEANNKGGAQFYNGCGQIKVTGSGSASLPAGVDMTKAYSADDAGVLYNMYGGDDSSYEIPGPKVWDGAATGSSSPAPSKPTPSAAAPAQSSAPAEESSAAPKPTATAAPVEQSEDSEPAAPSPSAAAPSTGNSGSSLPETFTITQFISWLKETAGSSSSKARRAHPRAFRV